MKKTILNYGLYSSSLLIVLFGVSFIFEGSIDYSMSEIIGYISIILSLTFIYFGIKFYRDTINNGLIKFLKGLKIGLLITIFPSLAFGFINVVYTTYINPNFTTDYYNHSIESFRETLPAVEFQAKLIELESQREIFGNPYFNFFLMTLTVFIIGFLITVISSLILKRNL